jgi:hypothetical protein
VNEYLKLAANADKQQRTRIKTVFEKKNQKSAHNILQLQKKLDSYTKKLRNYEMNGAQVAHRQPREVLRDMGQGLKYVRLHPPNMSYLFWVFCMKCALQRVQRILRVLRPHPSFSSGRVATQPYRPYVSPSLSLSSFFLFFLFFYPNGWMFSIVILSTSFRFVSSRHCYCLPNT